MMKKAIKSVVNHKAYTKKELRKETSRLAAIANKRLKRLEKGGYTSSPAYKKYQESKGGEKFGIRGKSFNEVQQELSKLKTFLNSETSTITGVKSNIKKVSKLTGVPISKTDSYEEQTKKQNLFFELSSKVEQYLKAVEGTGASVGYNDIWGVVSNYVKDVNLEISTASPEKIEDMIVEISNLISNTTKEKDNPFKDNSDFVFLN